MALAVPGRLANDARALRHPLVSEQSDQREQSQRTGAVRRTVRSDQCRCVSNPQALAHLLESSFHLPSPDKPGDDPLGVSFEAGA